MADRGTDRQRDGQTDRQGDGQTDRQMKQTDRYTGGGPVISHNNMVSAWSDCLSQLQLHHVKEPRGRYVNSEDRSDIVVFDSASGVDLELDIALAHPWSNEIEGLSATTQRAVATRRENLKIKKYDHALLPGCFRPTFVPIVLEHLAVGERKPKTI